MTAGVANTSLETAIHVKTGTNAIHEDKIAAVAKSVASAVDLPTSPSYHPQLQQETEFKTPFGRLEGGCPYHIEREHLRNHVRPRVDVDLLVV